MARRLRATRLADATLAYPGPAGFVADVALLQDALAAAGAPRQAFGELQRLRWQAETSAFAWPAWRSGSTARCTSGAR